MKLSVLIPVYNVEDYLEECVDSVLNQSNQNFEIILVNDGSTDTSGEICNRLKKEHPDKIKLIHKENEGLLLARWEAIQAASGEVLVFLDSDDCLRLDALEILADCFNETHCDMVLYDSSDRKDFSNKIQFFPFQHRFCMVGMEKSVLYQRVAERKIPNSVCMKATDFPNPNDLRNVKSGEDLLLSLYSITAAQKIVYINETLYFYRQREGSIVHSFNPGMMQSIKTVNMELEKFVEIWGMSDLYPLIYAREARSAREKRSNEFRPIPSARSESSNRSVFHSCLYINGCTAITSQIPTTCQMAVSKTLYAFNCGCPSKENKI